MGKLLSILLLIGFAHRPLCQICTHTMLSKKFDFKTEIKRIKIGQYNDSCIIKVTITGKSNKNEVQRIIFYSEYLFEKSFRECASVRSYVTQQNAKADILDNDFGDLVVADLNFDGKEDFAVKRDAGGNGGPLYNFYIQKNGKFIFDKFLSENMEYFSYRIDKRHHTLLTLVHAGVSRQGKTVFSCDRRVGKWRKLKHTFVSY